MESTSTEIFLIKEQMLHSNSPRTISDTGTTTLTRYHRFISCRRYRDNLPDVYVLGIDKTLSVCYPSSSGNLSDGCVDSRSTAPPLHCISANPLIRNQSRL